MITVRKETEVTVRIRNEPSVFEKLFGVIHGSDIPTLAHTTFQSHDWAIVLLVTENPCRTRQALEEEGFDCRNDTVVVVRCCLDRTGFAARFGIQLRAAGIGTLYSYVSQAKPGQFNAVFKTMDDDRAVRVLQGGLAVLLSDPCIRLSPAQEKGGGHDVAVRS